MYSELSRLFTTPAKTCFIYTISEQLIYNIFVWAEIDQQMLVNEKKEKKLATDMISVFKILHNMVKGILRYGVSNGKRCHR